MSSLHSRSKPTIDEMIPPSEMNFVGGGDYKRIGEVFLEKFKKYGLKPHHRVLDVGCGLGRIAVHLTDYLSERGQYDGFDIRADGIQWCQEKITPGYPNFHFKHVPLRNTQYLPEEGEDAAEFTFPYPSRSFDFVILTSVFTHLSSEVVCRYLDEINRVLKRGGRMAATFFLFSRDSKKHELRLSQYLSFPHRFGHYRVQLLDNPDAAIAYEEAWVTAQCERRGLQIKWPVRRGFQDVVLAEKRRSLPLRQRWRSFRHRLGL